MVWEANICQAWWVSSSLKPAARRIPRTWFMNTNEAFPKLPITGHSALFDGAV